MNGWKEVSRNCWQRPIGDNERFIKYLGDRSHRLSREHWSVTAGASFKLSGPIAEHELSKIYTEAWCALRFLHPSIACTASNDELTYVVPTPETLRLWASESMILHKSDEVVENVLAALQPTRYPSIHVFPAESQHQILLHLAHWRTDGYGALQLVAAFLSCLSHKVGGHQGDPSWGDEIERLTPGVEYALGLPVQATPEIRKTSAELLRTLTLSNGSVGVALNIGNETSPGGTRFASLKFGRKETTTIQQACDRRDIDINSALHASCAQLTYREALPEQRENHYTSTMRFTLRPHLPAPYNTPAYAAGLYTGGFMIAMSASGTWLENARSYKRGYDRGITPAFLGSRRQYAIDVLRVLQTLPSQPDFPPSAVDISSVGDADLLVQSNYVFSETVIDVEEISVGVETVTPQIYCFLWIFKGQLELRLVYNEAYYCAERVSRMVEQLGLILESELEVKACKH